MLEVISTWWIWAILSVVFALAELLFVGFYMLPLAIAASISALAAWLSPISALPYGWMVPCFVFMLVSIVLMMTLRPAMVRWMYIGGRALNLDALVGQEARVIQAIDPATGSGQVRIERELWAASSTSGEFIPEGAIVEVLEIRGNRAAVKHKK